MEMPPGIKWEYNISLVAACRTPSSLASAGRGSLSVRERREGGIVPSPENSGNGGLQISTNNNLGMAECATTITQANVGEDMPTKKGKMVAKFLRSVSAC